MKFLTCGSRLEIPTPIMDKFNGIIADYFWSQKSNDEILEIARKYNKTQIRKGFLYGNKHKLPDPSSGCATLEEWVGKRVLEYNSVNEWVLINEFINQQDKFNPYPGYEYDNLKRYFLKAAEVNPTAKLIISDFRPHQLERWRKIKSIVEDLLTENIPIHGVGIQVHCKTTNAHSHLPLVPFILDALPTVIKMFDGVCPVHLSEVSAWRHYSESPDELTPLWGEILAIANSMSVESFCPWWLNEYDEAFPRKMPSFDEFVGAGIYDVEWRQRYPVI